jgi:hypothetical protein
MLAGGYEEYKKREFCKDVRCPIQLELNSLEPGSEDYERVRKTCQTSCKHTAWEFHHWLIEKGYLIIRRVEEASLKDSHSSETPSNRKDVRPRTPT